MASASSKPGSRTQKPALSRGKCKFGLSQEHCREVGKVGEDDCRQFDRQVDQMCVYQLRPRSFDTEIVIEDSCIG